MIGNSQLVTRKVFNLAIKYKQKIFLNQVYDLNNLKLSRDRLQVGGAPGLDGKIKIHISDVRLEQLSKDLKQQKYSPKPIRRIVLPKFNGGVRLLGISSVIDKIVQGTLVQLLSYIVDPVFSKYSYGFRPGCGCHDALQFIKLN